MNITRKGIISRTAKMEKLSIVLVVIVCGIVFGLFINKALNEQAVIDCTELQKQATELQAYHPSDGTGFYITKDQKAECASVHMTVNAAVL